MGGGRLKWRGATALLIPLVMLALIHSFGGCTLPRSGEGPGCTTDADCDVGNVCVVPVCDPSGRCLNESLDGVELPEAQPSDREEEIELACERPVCVAGEMVIEADPTDLPSGCTFTCDETDAVLVDAPDTPCVEDGVDGRCDELGLCVPTCTVDDDCVKADEPCTLFTCVDGGCQEVPLTGDINTVPALQPFDDQFCLQPVCINGDLAYNVDDTNLDDVSDDPCIESMGCSEGIAVYVAVTDNVPCPTGFCDGKGACQECLTEEEGGDALFQCGDMGADPDCQRVVCTEDHVCAIENLPFGTPVLDTTADCMQDVCLGDGTTIEQVIADNQSAPDAEPICTFDVCELGVQLHLPAPDDTVCGPGTPEQECLNGVCQGCTTDSDCDVRDRFCADYTCEDIGGGAFACVATSFTTAGTPLPNVPQFPDDPPQAPGDCHQLQCDGATPNPINPIDNTDVPNDGLQCTQDICTAGVPDNVPLTNQPCPNTPGNWCNQFGLCVQCTPTHEENCNAAGGPSGAGAVCQHDNCVNFSCVIEPDANNAEDTDITQTPGDCQRLVCNGAIGGTKSVANNNDLPNDGNECTADSCSSGTPVCQPLASGTMCSGGVCNGAGNNVCNSNDPACVQCVVDTDCPSPSTQDCVGNVCLLENGQPCGGNGVCASNFCRDGVCCNNTCGGVCRRCNVAGSVGTCANIPAGTDPDNECANGACDGGVCKSDNGQTCTMGSQCLSGNCPTQDGVCCDMACSGLCEACLASKTPSATGTCDDIDADTDPDMECIGATLCDGAGVCELLSNGTSCSQNGECMSNFCVDGVCCNNACPGACEACNLGGSIGTCTDRAAGAAGSPSCAPYLCDGNNGTCPNTCVDSGDCSAGNYCNASNNCVAQQANGSMCGDPEECTSGNCVDGFCCNSACGGVCQACDGDMTAGAAGTCSFINSGADPENECPGPQTCDGAGACM